jgi:hypothetical protein
MARFVVSTTTRVLDSSPFSFSYAVGRNSLRFALTAVRRIVPFVVPPLALFLFVA